MLKAALFIIAKTCGEGNGNPLQYSCLGNLMDRGAWQATVHGGCRESDTMEGTNTERAKTSTVFTQANQGCMVLAVNAIGICTGMSKC